MRDEWERHARMYALTANVNRDPKKQKKAFESHEFNPYADQQQRKRSRVKVSMGALMAAMFDRDGSRMARELSEHGQCRSNPGGAGEC